jgi:iron complex outermembrane recepter protein
MRNHSVAWGLLGMMLTCPGLAQEQVSDAGLHRVSIPAEPLGDALSDLAKQTGLQVLISSRLVEGVRSRELKGTFSADEALSQLLQNTGLQFTFVNPRTVAINAAASEPGDRSESESKSSGEAKGPADGSEPDANSIEGGTKMQNRGFIARLLGAFALCGSATHSGTACAQEADAAGAAPLEEVVVTAQKRTERLLDVPMSVATLTGEQLASAGITSTLELQQITPGVVTTNNGLGFSPAIRGVSSSATTPGDESNVAIYIDDVYVGTPIAGFFDLQDIERVEVLKGPQGTLFGRNATGGAIRIVTRAPSFTPQAKLSADYGFDFEELNLGAYVTGPLSDTVAASLSGSYRTGDGYVEGIGPNVGRQYAEPDNYVYRGKLLFQPSDGFKVTVAGDAWRNQNDVVFIATPPDGVNPFPGSIPTTPFHYAGSTQPKATVEGKGASIDATWDVSDSLTIRSITGYREVEGEYQADVDRTNLAGGGLALGQEQENFSQEFNLSGPADQAVTWLVGAYYYASEGSNPYYTFYLNADAPDGRVFSNFTNKVKTESYAGFGDLTWHATSQLHLTAGARYSSETKEFDYQQLTPAAAPLPTREKTWDSPTYRGVVRYDFTDDANVYASWSNGFKSGVYNAYSPVGIPVNPEEIDAIEIGAKARVAGVTFTAAAYDYDYTDLQVQAHVTFNGVLITTLTNAASARIRGFELSANGNLTDALSFDIGFNWLPTAEYEDYTRASVVRPCTPTDNCVAPVSGVLQVPYDASDSRVIKAPKWTGNLRLTYTTQLFGGQFIGTLSDNYNPGFYWQAGNFTEEGAYNVANARLAWTDATDRFTYSLWGTNLSDERYSTYTTPNVRGNSNTYPQGRQIGVGVSVSF